MAETRRIPRAGIALTGSLLLVGGVSIGYLAIDRAASDFVGRLKPDLERSLAGPLGHPVQIGAYEGLRPWGLALGASKILPAGTDRSHGSLEQLVVRVDPLASLRRWQPVLTLDVKGLRVQLHRDAKGRYWTPGESQGPTKLPRIRLNVRLLDPAQIRVAPMDQTFRLAGRAAVELADSWFQSSGRLQWLNKGGSVALQASGRWDRPQLVLRTGLKDLQLQRLASFASLPPAAEVRGRLDGDLRLQFQEGGMGCRGSVQLQRVRLRRDQQSEPLLTERLGLSCKDETVTLAGSPWRYGDWSAKASGSVALNRSFDLKLDLSNAKRKDRFDLRIDGPWTKPRWRVDGMVELPADSPVAGPLKLAGQLTTPWTEPDQPQARVDDLQLTAPGLRLRLQGDLFPELRLRSTDLSADPSVWQSTPGVTNALGTTTPVRGSLQTGGTLAQPELSLQLSQDSNPLLDRWDLKARWSKTTGLAVLERFDSLDLQAEGRIPLSVGADGVELGELQAGVELSDLNLARLSPLLKVPMAGTLSARGSVSGPLKALRPDLALMIRDPRVGSLQVPETWRGHLRGVVGQGATLQLASKAGGQVSGTLQAELAADFWPTRLSLQRGDGQLSIDGRDRAYRWQAERFVLDGLQLALPPEQRFQGVSGDLSGDGRLAFAPFVFSGAATINEPATMGIPFDSITLEGRLADDRFRLEGTLAPTDGEMRVTADGVLGGALRSRAEVSGVSASWLINLARQLRGQDPLVGANPGRAQDLGEFVIETFGGSIDGQLKALALSKQALALYEQEHPQKGFDPRDLQGRVDGVIALNGPRPSALQLDLQAQGHLWLNDQDRDLALQMEPIVAVVRGPISGGDGDFTLLHLPFSLMALFAPIPSALKGAVGLTGRYRFGADGPSIESALAFEAASLGAIPLVLDRRVLTYGPKGISVDLALRGENAKEPITVLGTVPLGSDEALDLEIESHGDALNVLTPLAGTALDVKRGSTDLRLILRGTLADPKANGFVVMRDGDLSISGQQIRKLNASMLFDFNRLEVQKLEAELVAGGSFKGAGAIGLFEPRQEEKPLSIELSNGRIRQSIVEVMANGRISVEGSLQSPVLSGDMALNHGVIQPRQSLLTRVRGTVSGAGSNAGSASPMSPRLGSSVRQPVTLDSLIEEQWDFKEPLVMFGPGSTPKPSPEIQAFMPNLPAVRFRNLRLQLGPDLAVRMPPFVNFRGGGQLLLNGPLDESLQARGLIRLNRGRVSLFSTTFRLDPRAPNVAVFTPSLGLVPYVDIAMKSRVSDSVQLNTAQGASSNIFETNGQGSEGLAGGQLRLVKVTVQASGPANRLMGNLVLRSSPPMSQSQLVSLIGGNSLAGLTGGNAGAALATVLGQTILSPVLGTLSDVMGERLHVALYPTYVTPSVKSEEERQSGRVPPTFTIVTEAGLDVSDRFDFSVLAAPDNSDVPPQASVTYQVNPNTTLSGSIDTDGTWQTQLRMFFRF